jgi:hypothetical protein
MEMWDYTILDVGKMIDDVWGDIEDRNWDEWRRG